MQIPDYVSGVLRSPFSAVVETTAIIPGAIPNSTRASILVVKIVAGVVHTNDKVFLQSRADSPLVIDGIEMNRAIVSEGYASETVGLLFKGIDLSSVIAGELMVAAR